MVPRHQPEAAPRTPYEVIPRFCLMRPHKALRRLPYPPPRLLIPPPRGPPDSLKGYNPSTCQTTPYSLHVTSLPLTGFRLTGYDPTTVGRVLALDENSATGSFASRGVASFLPPGAYRMGSQYTPEWLAKPLSQTIGIAPQVAPHFGHALVGASPAR